jgi:FAD dependent monooxygenase
MGANMAIESAVALCNVLQASTSSHAPNHHPTASELSALFSKYQSVRFDRAKEFMQISGAVTRMRSYQSLWKKFFITRIATLPFMQRTQVGQMMAGFAKGPKLEYVPTRTINMDADGWKPPMSKKSNGAPWVAYALVTSVIGIGMSYAAVLKWGFPLSGY